MISSLTAGLRVTAVTHVYFTGTNTVSLFSSEKGKIPEGFHVAGAGCLAVLFYRSIPMPC